MIERKNSPETPLTPWPSPERAWMRLHADFLGQYFGDMFLLVIDAHSKWVEVVNFKNKTKAGRVIEVLNRLFTRFGLSLHLVTDNGRQFRGKELARY